VFLGGVESTGLTPEKVCRLGVARTFQVPQPFVGMTAYESVLVAATFGARSDDRLAPATRAKEALELIGFDKEHDTPVATLNTIELKQLDLGRALASKPDILLLDELAAGLMTGQLGHFIETVRRISALGVTIIMVEHVIDAIVSLCPRLVVLDHGEVLDAGATETVMRNPRVVEAYLGEGVAA
jgi:branched-chain amino acid transport system ATP-binding protein